MLRLQRKYWELLFDWWRGIRLDTVFLRLTSEFKAIRFESEEMSAEQKTHRTKQTATDFTNKTCGTTKKTKKNKRIADKNGKRCVLCVFSLFLVNLRCAAESKTHCIQWRMMKKCYLAVTYDCIC